jgi:hypothetical protein
MATYVGGDGKRGGVVWYNRHLNGNGAMYVL